MIDAMKQALEALKAINEMSKPPMNIPLAAEIDGAMDALRQAIEQAKKQEPVGWFAKSWQGVYVELMREAADAIPLYTAPPKREWVELTNKEIKKSFEMDWNSECPEWVIDFSKQIEAKLREKNT